VYKSEAMSTAAVSDTKEKEYGTGSSDYTESVQRSKISVQYLAVDSGVALIPSPMFSLEFESLCR
jgi:hypothetical protein